MYLYLYQSENMDNRQNVGRGEELATLRETLLWKTLEDYCGRNQLYPEHEALKSVSIKKEPKGKPYFANLPMTDGRKPASIHFSVSHSGSWWGCLMADEPVGFDLEVRRDKISYERISERFFTKEEHDWILARGKDAFFEVWVRKEAYVKFLGTGLGEGLSSYTVIENGELKQKVFSDKSGDGHGVINPCSVAGGVAAAYCCGSGSQIKETIVMKI